MIDTESLPIRLAIAGRCLHKAQTTRDRTDLVALSGASRETAAAFFVHARMVAASLAARLGSHSAYHAAQAAEQILICLHRQIPHKLHRRRQLCPARLGLSDLFSRSESRADSRSIRSPKRCCTCSRLLSCSTSSAFGQIDRLRHAATLQKQKGSEPLPAPDIVPPRQYRRARARVEPGFWPACPLGRIQRLHKIRPLAEPVTRAFAIRKDPHKQPAIGARSLPELHIARGCCEAWA